MKKIRLLLVLLSTGAILFANGSQEQDAASENVAIELTEPGTFPIAKAPLRISAFAEVDAGADIEHNAYLERMEEETNIHLDIVARPATQDDARTIKTLLLASNDYPEVFLTGQNSAFTMQEMVQYGQVEGILIPIDQLIKDYCPTLMSLYGEMPSWKKIMTAPDGRMYGIARNEQSGHCTAYDKMWVNMAYLDALHMDMPETVDEFYNMLVAFKNDDPNGNGIQDEIPLAGSLEDPIATWIVNAFLPFSPYFGNWMHGSNFCYSDKNGKIVFSADKEAYRDAVRFMRKIYAEGLVDIASFSQKPSQLKQTVMQKPLRVGAVTAMHPGMFIDQFDEEALRNYQALPPVAGPAGVRFQPSVNGPSGVGQNTMARSVITDRCKSPEAAIRMMEYMLIPGKNMMRRRYGVEGVDWESAPAGLKNIRGGEFLYSMVAIEEGSDLGKTKADRAFNAGAYWDSLVWRDKRTAFVEEEKMLTDPTFFESRLEWETMKVSPFLYQYELPQSIFMDIDDTEEFNDLITNLNSYVDRSLTQFITGDMDVETDWDTYLEGLQRFGLDRMLELYQKAFDNYSK
jgi:putative aldouronate transport system substrate-binding protein